MRVSAIYTSSFQTMFYNRNSNQVLENNPASSFVMPEQTNSKEKNYKALFDAINEWKSFCHSQIEQGKFDIIA